MRYYVNEGMLMPWCEYDYRWERNEFYLALSVVSALAWGSLYFVVLDFADNGADYACRAVTLVHALISFFGCSYDCYVLKEHYTEIILSRQFNSEFENLMISMSLGYFIFDLLWCLTYSFESFPMVVHHIAALSLLGLTTHTQNSGAEVVSGLMGSEFTSVFLNIRWMIKFYGYYKDQMLGLLIDVFFVFIFIVCRVIIAGVYLYYLLPDPRSQTYVRISFTLFYIVNFFFFIEVVTFARYRYRKYTIRGI